MDVLDALPLFLAVAEDLSFTGAARRLGLSRSATGKAVARLEASLGVTLFQRTTRRVRLTDAGEILFERARAIRGEWQSAQALLAETRAEPRGRLRIGLPTIGHRLVTSHLAAFRDRYPLVSLDLDQDDRFADLTTAGIDVAIRSGALNDASHRSRVLTEFAYMLCAAPDYIERYGVPIALSDLGRHAQVRFRFTNSERVQPWRLKDTDDAASGTPAVTCTNMEGVLSLTRTGFGIAQMPDFLAADDIAEERLVEILAATRFSETFWLVWPHHLHRTPNVRAFVDHMVQCFSQSAFSG